MDVTANLAATNKIGANATIVTSSVETYLSWVSDNTHMNEEWEWRVFSVDNAFLRHFGKSFVKRRSAFWLDKG